ncbi:MAG: hypothetical protein JO257_17940 [Deltaproteobacteria bacterium]|nr:hypothetical protein [Deltaproteobacteria bacterium]
MKSALALALVLAACGGSSSPSGGGPDGSTGGNHDAPSAPAMVTFSGTVQSKGTSTSPLAGVSLGAYGEGSSTAVATATSDSQGNFTMMIPTGGTALQGYVKATFNGYVDTYLYPPTAVAADTTGVTVFMVTPSTYDLLANTLCQGNQMTTNGGIAVEVLDASMAKVQGATVASMPAATKYCYNQGGFPNKSATSTDTDGIAYMLNVTGTATVSASKSGLTFKSHQVNARAGALTLTIIQP